MKVSGGLVRSTLNPSAPAKFFLISPKLAGLAGEDKSMVGSPSTTSVPHHHALISAVLAREDNMRAVIDHNGERFASKVPSQFCQSGPKKLLDKPEWIRNCSHLADHFTSRIFEKYSL